MVVDTAKKATPKKKLGRPRKATTSESKRKRREEIRKYKRTSVGLSSAYEAWNELRKRGKWTHGELALHLLHVHSSFCLQPNCKVSVPMEETTEAGVARADEMRQSETGTRFEKSSNKIAPVPDPGAEIVASYRPIRSKEELEASRATGSIDGEKNVTILPKPVRNQNDASKPDSNAASVSVDKIVAPQENMTETSEGEQEQEEQEEEGEEEDENEGEKAQEEKEVVQEEVEKQELSNVDDFLTFQENLEPEENGIKDGNGSDIDNEGCEKDSGWIIALDSDLIFKADDDDEKGYSSEEGENLKKKRQKLDHGVADLPFKRFNTAEVAKPEGVSSTGSNRNRIRKVYWTEMERVYRCKLCLFEDSNAYSTTGHLLQEHAEIVGDLVDYLKERPATDPESGSTLYDMVMEFPPSSDGTDATNKGSESCDKIGEEKDSVEFPEEESKANESKAKETGRMEKKDNPFDTMESVELLKRWVKLQISCQHCQQGFNSYLFNDKGERTIHKCRLGKVIPVLCDICGKSFKHQSAFKLHWTETHCKPEQTVCPYCGKMVRVLRLTAHILKCHTSKKDEHLCGICRKGFRTKHGRDTHEVIHQKEKPFKCTYCQRGFTQSSNMRYHMRQHTGEKPYHCEICPESFAHNVSLKNHLKSKHGIDPWKMDATGD